MATRLLEVMALLLRPSKRYKMALTTAAQGHKCWWPMVFITRQFHFHRLAVPAIGYKLKLKVMVLFWMAHRLSLRTLGSQMRQRYIYGSLKLRRPSPILNVIKNAFICTMIVQGSCRQADITVCRSMRAGTLSRAL